VKPIIVEHSRAEGRKRYLSHPQHGYVKTPAIECSTIMVSRRERKRRGDEELGERKRKEGWVMHPCKATY